MTEFSTPEFGEQPRSESLGESAYKYAEWARLFLRRVLAFNLTDKQTEALAVLIAASLVWWSKVIKSHG